MLKSFPRHWLRILAQSDNEGNSSPYRNAFQQPLGQWGRAIKEMNLGDPEVFTVMSTTYDFSFFKSFGSCS